jgi:hypothetical protein
MMSTAMDWEAEQQLVLPILGREMLTCELSLSFSGNPPQMNRAFSNDESNHLRHRIFWWNRNQQVDVVMQKLVFLDSTLLPPCQLLKHLSQMPSQLNIQCLSSALRDEHSVILAFPSCRT